MLGGETEEVLYGYLPIKSHLSLILWSSRKMALCSFTIFGTVPVKNGDLRAASPAVKSLAGGRRFQVANMAGLSPRLRGSRGLQVGVEPTSQAPLKVGLS